MTRIGEDINTDCHLERTITPVERQIYGVMLGARKKFSAQLDFTVQVLSKIYLVAADTIADWALLQRTDAMH